MTVAPAFPPLVEAYLADLDRALSAADPRERAETLAAVREHAAEALALHGTDDTAARRVLDELGTVDAIAAEATPAGPAAASTAATPTPAADVWLLVLAVASLVAFVVPVLAAAAVIWAIVRFRSSSGNRTVQGLALGLGSLALVGSLALYVSHVLAAG